MCAVHQLAKDGYMFNDNTGFNTAMITVLYITRAVHNYEEAVPVQGGYSQQLKAQHVTQMNVLRRSRAEKATAAEKPVMSGHVEIEEVKIKAAKARETESIAQQAAADARTAASKAAIAENNSKEAADRASVLRLDASNLEMQLKIITAQETTTALQVAIARKDAAAGETVAAHAKQMAAEASALASAALEETETAKARASEAAIAENNSRAAADHALLLRLDASNMEMQLKVIAAQHTATAIQKANARAEAATAETAAAWARQEASATFILAAEAQTRNETAKAGASNAKIAADQAEAEIRTEQQRQLRSQASLTLRQEVAKIEGLRAAIDLANANRKELEAQSDAALAEATRLSKQTAAQKAKEDTEDRILRLEAERKEREHAEHQAAEQSRVIAVRVAAEAAEAERVYDASPQGLAAAEAAKKLAAAMAADQVALAAAADQLAAASAAAARAAVIQQHADQSAENERHIREVEDRKWTHGVLKSIPWAPKLCVGFLLFFMLLLMSTNLELITQLASSTTLKSARAGLLALVLGEGGAWFLWMLYNKGWTLNALFARCTKRRIVPSSVEDPAAALAANQPTLPDDWLRSKMSRGLLTFIFLLVAGPVTSIYMLVGLFFWDLHGSKIGLASPTMMTGWQTTHLVLLMLCTQGIFLVVPSLVISSFVVVSTVCPSSCSQASSGISLCNTDPASVKLLQLLPCSAATCGVLTNGSADTTPCFLDVHGRTAAQSSLAFSVISLVGYIVIGILLLIFRSSMCLKECFRIVFERRISSGRVSPV